MGQSDDSINIVMVSMHTHAFHNRFFAFLFSVHKKVEAATIDHVAKKGSGADTSLNTSVTAAATEDESTPYKPTAKRKSTDNSSKELDAVSAKFDSSFR